MRTLLGLLAALPSLLALPAGALSGVCPDGSIFVVQSASAIPCPEAKRVDPNDLPPILPGNLPRPYGWERFNRRSDPNNPYNVVDAAGPDGAFAPTEAPAPETPTSPVASALAAVTPPPAARGPELALTRDELADLDQLVALMQELAPATLSDLGDDGARRATLALARSSAFEARLHAALSRSGGGVRGPVVLFRAEAQQPGSFHGNLTFVQSHVAFHPDPANPDQFGVLDGGLGALAPGQRVLGYAVLPEHLDPSRPLDVYWDDRRITATLQP